MRASADGMELRACLIAIDYTVTAHQWKERAKAYQPMLNSYFGTKTRLNSRQAHWPIGLRAQLVPQ